MTNLPKSGQGQQAGGRYRGMVRCGVSTLLLVGGILAMTPRMQASETFTAPSKEELAMKSVPGYPGVPAVVLYREELTKDDLHVIQHYDRVKILTEGGKRYGTVELRTAARTDVDDLPGDARAAGDVVGRTIHPDGTIIPFTGKPYVKVIERASGFKVQSTVFSMPDVEVGSIIEYRYAIRNENYFDPPTWMIQGPLPIRMAHYSWYPTTKQLVSSTTGDEINSITWYPLLPIGAKIVKGQSPSSDIDGRMQLWYDLVLKDVPPTPNAPFLPPTSSFAFRVAFEYTNFHVGNDYWKAVGKQWSSGVKTYTDPGGGDLKPVTQGIIAGATTQDAKLRKIYAKVMELENSEFTRVHGAQEENAAGLVKTSTAWDVMARKRGAPDQLAELFAAMARAAGMKVYVMRVPDRKYNLFAPEWLNARQLSDEIVIVNVDGKEMAFDPGSRYCAYGQLAWEHTLVMGMRQTDDGSALVGTPSAPYDSNKTTRLANLTVDEAGAVVGTIVATYTGAPALQWRQTALHGDTESVRTALHESMESVLPGTVETKVTDVQNLEDYGLPLVVKFSVKGSLGTAVGHRLLVPVDVFLAKSGATFPDEKREYGIYFDYPQMVQDVQRINLPPTMTVEAAPESSQFKFQTTAAYTMNVTSTAVNVTARRDYVSGSVIVPAASYTALRTFYSQFEAKDHETIVLKAVDAGGSKGN